MSAKELDNTISTLLSISKTICEYEQLLIFLSKNQKENSKQYQKIITILRNLINSERMIITLLSINDLKRIREKLYIIMAAEDNDHYNRTYNLIINAIKENEIDNPDDNNDLLDDDNQTDTESKDDNKILSEYDKALKYILFTENFERKDTHDIEEYADSITRRIQIIVLKKIGARIIETEALSKEEKDYKQALLDFLIAYKYRKLTVDYELERIAIECGFNIENIPIPSLPNIDLSSIDYNQCITLLNELYDISTKERNTETIAEALFYLMCLEEHIKELNSNDLNSLLCFCERTEELSDNNTFGNYAKGKIKVRLKNTT